MYSVNLSEAAIRNYTWRDVRDAIRRSFVQEYNVTSISQLAYSLSHPESKRKYWLRIFWRSHPSLLQGHRAYLKGDRLFRRLDQKAYYTHDKALAGELQTLLQTHDLITESRELVDRWELTEKGAGLFRQKRSILKTESS